jgi:hypothetical protein
MLFDIDLPQSNVELKFKIYDKDLFSPDDYISECEYNITELLKKAFENEVLIKDLGPKNDEIIEIIT